MPSVNQQFEIVREKLLNLALANLHGEDQTIARFLLDSLEDEGKASAVKDYLEAIAEGGS